LSAGDINLLSDVMAGFFGPTLVYRRGMMETIKKTYKEYILFYATSQYISLPDLDRRPY
jgi:hypothetical protein